MRSSFYFKLAVTNIKKNSKTYVPYILTGTITVAMFYIMRSIIYNPGIKEMPGADALLSILGMGMMIVFLFSCIFLFYTNSFLMKQRKKELGLYNVLGMGKSHLARMMIVETLIIAAAELVFGILSGIVLSKMIFLIFVKIVRFHLTLEFVFEPKAIEATAILFGGIFLAILIYNIWQVVRIHTIELLHSGRQGEREPRTKVLMTIIGLGCLGTGYAIALTVEQPLKALTYFMIAVILVIIGTYCLFVAGSIALLKLMRRKKSYYYKTSHFISVSGMIYRMKQNAVGLANICILSTMVLIMVSTTVSLYVGLDNVMETRFPYDFNGVIYQQLDEKEQKELIDMVYEQAAEAGTEVEDENVYRKADIMVIPDGVNRFRVGNAENGIAMDAAVITLVPLADYNRMNGSSETLKAGEVIACSSKRNQTADVEQGGLELGTKKLRVKKAVSEFSESSVANMRAVDTLYLVLPDLDSIQDVLDTFAEQPYESIVETNLDFNFKGEKEAVSKAAHAVLEKIEAAGFAREYVEIRADYREDFFSFYGGFLFLGIYFGSLFLMATVLIIYYKQISEGYEDRERFQIMQKVGMSRREVRKAIHSQIISVFALPLFLAVIHICAAFKIIVRLLEVMNLTDVALFRNCTIVTITVFGLMYAVVYLITAKEYYRIVK